MILSYGFTPLDMIVFMLFVTIGCNCGLFCVFLILSGFIANGTLIDYNDIDEMISTFDYI